MNEFADQGEMRSMKCTIFAMTLAAIFVAAARGDERRPTGATTQPARWVIEARIVETAATTRPATQPATTTQPVGTVLIGAFEWPEDAEPLFRPDAKPLASIEVLAMANEPFSATATVGGTESSACWSCPAAQAGRLHQC
ncbi:MAG: hypothetical protein WBD40_09345 [Tepidisphaeraceae bacterium]